ncbi:MAG: hypothetical protein WAN13_15365 [Candidatus Acidiferrales bacterium]
MPTCEERIVLDGSSIALGVTALQLKVSQKVNSSLANCYQMFTLKRRRSRAHIEPL